jgi:16S rRNA (cytosine1402-N4)-methyltransferase
MGAEGRVGPASGPGGDPRFEHAPVLVEEVAGLLRGCARVLDGTVGAGGHAARLMAQGARVLGLDRDADAVRAATERLGGAAEVRQGDFAEAVGEPDVLAFRPDAILLDLGVSSPQVDDPQRGFSFRPHTPLDMRMTAGRGRTAADWLNTEAESVLAVALRDWADERRARPVAREIVRRRATRAFATSDDLVGAIRAVLGPRSGPDDFARIFQAVRIAVNGEIERLERALPALLQVLEAGGVIAVISYHSGEDRVVKQAMREWERACVCPPAQPVCTCRGRPLGVPLTRRPVRATPGEIQRNPRARSARLRAFRKAA